MMKNNKTKVHQYRKDIDGLRAVAVLLVIIAHAKFSFLEGGFIGVDVFFVISGFLITSILQREITNGSFSIVNFYLRRVRRILPALTFLLLGTSLASLFILFPADLELFARSSFASITAWANIFFGKIQGGYWGKDVSIMPLAHIWSLAIEEQFYFIWPLLLLCAHKFIPKKYFLHTLLGLFVALFITSVQLSTTSKGYYHLGARAFEIQLGALVAIFGRRFAIGTTKRSSLIISGLGLFLILISALVLTENTTFPGWNALWPCLGAALLVLPREQRSFVDTILESKPMNFIGKISYSLYLWHWPIFAFIIYSGHSLEDWRWSAIFATFALATFSFYKVEQAYRFKKEKAIPTFGKLLVIPVACVAIFFGLSDLTNGYSFRYTGKEKIAVEAIRAKTSKLFKGCSNSDLESGKLSQPSSEICYWGGEPKEKEELLLVGDSHANAIRGFVEVLSQDAGLRGLQITQTGISYFPDLYMYDPAKEKSVLASGKYGPIAKEYIKSSPAKYVVFTGRFAMGIHGSTKKNSQIPIFLEPTDSIENITVEKSRKTYLKYFKKTVEDILAFEKKVVLIKDVPEMEKDYSRDGVRSALLGVELGTITKRKVLERQRMVNDVIDELDQKYENVIAIDPKDIICPKDTCYSAIDSMPLYYDDDHLNYYGSRYIGEKYLEKFKNPFTNF